MAMLEMILSLGAIGAIMVAAYQIKRILKSIYAQ